MSARARLVIFAKQPRRGQVKRRLAAGIGDGPAVAFYRAALAGLIGRLARGRGWRTQLALTPDRPRRRGWRWPRRVEIATQGMGDLGQRMTRACRRCARRPVVIIGADIPEIQAIHIFHAIHALARAEVVFGPAPDGGYWLVGLRQGRQVGRMFNSVRWSTSHALADTRANLPRCWRVTLLDALDDIDDAAALARWRARKQAG